MFKWYGRWLRLVIVIATITALAIGSGAGLRWGCMAEYFLG